MMISVHPCFHVFPTSLEGFTPTTTSSSSSSIRQAKVAPPVQAHAASLVSSSHQDPDYVCSICKAKEWLICDFCNGQKTNIQVKNNKMYRRCPSCKAAGVVICPQCKVFKCVTFPDGKDGAYEM